MLVSYFILKSMSSPREIRALAMVAKVKALYVNSRIYNWNYAKLQAITGLSKNTLKVYVDLLIKANLAERTGPHIVFRSLKGDDNIYISRKICSGSILELSRVIHAGVIASLQKDQYDVIRKKVWLLTTKSNLVKNNTTVLNRIVLSTRKLQKEMNVSYYRLAKTKQELLRHGLASLISEEVIRTNINPLLHKRVQSHPDGIYTYVSRNALFAIYPENIMFKYRYGMNLPDDPGMVVQNQSKLNKIRVSDRLLEVDNNPVPEYQTERLKRRCKIIPGVTKQTIQRNEEGVIVKRIFTREHRNFSKKSLSNILKSIDITISNTIIENNTNPKSPSEKGK